MYRYILNAANVADFRVFGIFIRAGQFIYTHIRKYYINNNVSMLSVSSILLFTVHFLHNMTGGYDSDCVRFYPEEEQWRCFIAPVSNINHNHT